MALDSKILRKRLKEAFGKDSQETVAKNLNMTQGNVSKLLSGNQQPTLETIYHIADVYNVSVDWLLGMSEKKRITKYAGRVTYAEAIMTLSDLKQHGADVMADKQGADICVKAEDPLIKALLKKALALLEADREMYADWVENKLSHFDDKPLLWYSTWRDDPVSFLAGQAVTESNWLEVYEAAVDREKAYAEMMGPDENPFSR